MKRVVIAVALAAAMAGFASAQGTGEHDAEKHAVAETVAKSYFGVVFLGGDLQDFERGFHSDFNMYVLSDGKLDKRTRQEWADRMAQARAKSTEGAPKVAWTHEIKMIDVTGPTAVAKVEISRDGTLQFTDYLSLYKFEDGWKIVAKLFTHHRS